MKKLKSVDMGFVSRHLVIFLGSFLFAFSINGLFIPHKLISGGLSGIAIMLEYLFKIPSGVTVFVLNIPLFIGGYRFIGKSFAYLSVFGTACVSVLLIVTSGWVLEVESTMIATIFGGLLGGIGAGLVIRSRGSLGGFDILSVIINKYFSFSVGGVSFAINAVILLIAAFLFNLEMALYTMVGIYVSNKAIDGVIEGINHKKTLVIVSDKNKEIAQELLIQIKRGITFINGQGAYSGKDKQLIYTVVRTMELSKIREIVRKVDPDAFLSIIDTREVEGKGFKYGDVF